MSFEKLPSMAHHRNICVVQYKETNINRNKPQKSEHPVFNIVPRM